MNLLVGWASRCLPPCQCDRVFSVMWHGYGKWSANLATLVTSLRGEMEKVGAAGRAVSGVITQAREVSAKRRQFRRPALAARRGLILFHFILFFGSCPFARYSFGNESKEEEEEKNEQELVTFFLPRSARERKSTRIGF